MSKITVLLPEQEFAVFDAYCRDRGFKKSTLIARLIKEHLELQHFPSQAFLNLSSNLRGENPALPTGPE